MFLPIALTKDKRKITCLIITDKVRLSSGKEAGICVGACLGVDEPKGRSAQEEPTVRLLVIIDRGQKGRYLGRYIQHFFFFFRI